MIPPSSRPLRQWLRRWKEYLLEPIEPPAGSGRRLSRNGQLQLAGTILLAGLGLYAFTLLTMVRLSRNWNLCMPRDRSALMQEQVGQTLSLAEGLSYASTGQKLRLRQQIEELASRLDGLCWLVIHYRSHQMALLMVATTAGSLLSLTLVVGLPQGVLNLRNRVLQSVLVSNAFLLLFAVAVLQLSEVEHNLSSNLLLLQRHRIVLQKLQTSLANQALDPPPALPLDSAAHVAVLIRNQDQALQSLPMLAFRLNDAMAREWADRLMERSETPARVDPEAVDPSRTVSGSEAETTPGATEGRPTRTSP